MLMNTSWRQPLLPGVLLFSVALGAAQETKQPATENKAAGIEMPEAHFHHLHLNTLDPQAAIDFYTSKFDCEKARFAGLLDGVWAQKSWLLFTKVNRPPAWELTSAIWHFGWGAENMKAEYERQLKLGTKFFTPLTDISYLLRPDAKDLFYYAYAQSPDRALIELNTANHHRFGHLHLFSADPVEAGKWYQKYLGARPRPTPKLRFPSVSLMSDNVNIIIYSAEYTKQTYAEHWQGKTALESTKGRVVDHLGFSFANLPEALEKLRRDGVKITDELRTLAGGKLKFAFIEGPDKIRIELIEDHATKE